MRKIFPAAAFLALLCFAPVFSQIYMSDGDEDENYVYNEPPAKKKKIVKTKTPLSKAKKAAAQKTRPATKTPLAIAKPTRKKTKPAQQAATPISEVSDLNEIPKERPLSLATPDKNNGGYHAAPETPGHKTSLSKPLERENAPHKDTGYTAKSRRREIGGHIFPATVLFPSPIPSARFGFSQGFLTTKGAYLQPNEDGTIGRTNYSKYGFYEVFDSGLVFTDFAALDLNADIQLSAGMDSEDFLSIEASPQGDLRVGPVFYYKPESGKFLISFAPRLYYSKGASVSASYGMLGLFNALLDKLGNDKGFWTFYFDTAEQGGDPYNLDSLDELFTLVGSTYAANNFSTMTKGFTNNLVVNTSKVALSPSIGAAYPVTKHLGTQFFLEYQSIKEKYESADIISETIKYSQFNYGAGLSLDCRHWISFPLGLSLEFMREKNKYETRSSLGAGASYQGIGDIQLGLFMLIRKTEKRNSDLYWPDKSKDKLWMFNMTYFF